MKTYDENSKNRIWLNELGSAIIELNKGQISIIDEEDIELIASYRWSCWFPFNTFTTYAATHITVDKKRTDLRLHRLILNLDKYDNSIVDHVNRWGLDNRKSNLRIATHSQNLVNSKMHLDNTSGYRGVSRKRNGWRATIMNSGKQIYLGYYNDPMEAAKAYDDAAKELYGEFSRLNF